MVLEADPKIVPWCWTEKEQESFKNLLQCFETGEVLVHFDNDKTTVVQTDASDFALGASLLQEIKGVLRPVHFWSRKLTPAEVNYSTYDKELLAIVEACKTWRRHLTEIKDRFDIQTDHNNLRYFCTKQFLSPRQWRWYEDTLSQFTFRITYSPGKKNATVS